MGLAKMINKLSTERDYGSAFVDAMDLAIKSQSRPRTSRANIKPSKAGCLRQMYYLLQQSPVDGAETVNPDMVLIQNEGTAMHDIIQHIIANAKDQGIEFVMPEEEVKRAQARGINTEVRRSEHDAATPYEVTCYNTDYDISFKFDGVVVFLNKKVIFELKNEDHFKWSKRISPEEGHIQQATFYSLCLGINYILLVYVGRNYKKRKAYLVEITDEMRQTQVTRIRTAQYCRKHSIVPSKEDGKVCTYCGHKKQCKLDGPVTHEDKVDMKEILGLA